MKLLVTGAAGFVGSHLSRRLAREGHTVVGLDNFNEYYDVSLKEARAKEFLEGVELIRGDITDQVLVERTLSQGAFDAVCHLAAQAGVRWSLLKPEAYTHTNVVGTGVILEAARKAGVSRIVHASTSSVYGETKEIPFQEDNAATAPVSIYAATKRSAELLGSTYAHLYGMTFTALRFFTAYGAWGRPDMAYFSFTKNILEGKPITLFNHGDMKRDFTYIDDIVDGFVRALVAPEGYRVYNLGNGSPVQLEEFVSILEAALGIEAKREYAPMQPGDVPLTFADISRAREELGYSPKISFEEGIRNFVVWYREYFAGGARC